MQRPTIIISRLFETALTTDEDPKLNVIGHAGKVLHVTVTADKETVRAGEAVTFTADVSNKPDGEDLKYAWDFGDGKTDEASDASTTHTYKKKNNYVIHALNGYKTELAVARLTINVLA